MNTFKIENGSDPGVYIPQWNLVAGLSYIGSEIINVHKTKKQSEHNNT